MNEERDKRIVLAWMLIGNNSVVGKKYNVSPGRVREITLKTFFEIYGSKFLTEDKYSRRSTFINSRFKEKFEKKNLDKMIKDVMNYFESKKDIFKEFKPEFSLE